MKDIEDDILDFDITIAIKNYTPYKAELISTFNYRYDMIDWTKRTSYDEDIQTQLPYVDSHNAASSIRTHLTDAIKALLRISEIYLAKESGQPEYIDKDELDRLILDFSTLYVVWNFVKGDISIRWLYHNLYTYMHRMAVVSEFAHQCREEALGFTTDIHTENIMLLQQIEYVLSNDPNNRMLALMTVLFEADISGWDIYIENQNKHRS